MILLPLFQHFFASFFLTLSLLRNASLASHPILSLFTFLPVLSFTFYSILLCSSVNNDNLVSLQALLCIVDFSVSFPLQVMLPSLFTIYLFFLPFCLSFPPSFLSLFCFVLFYIMILLPLSSTSSYFLLVSLCLILSFSLLSSCLSFPFIILLYSALFFAIMILLPLFQHLFTFIFTPRFPLRNASFAYHPIPFLLSSFHLFSLFYFVLYYNDTLASRPALVCLYFYPSFPFT